MINVTKNHRIVRLVWQVRPGIRSDAGTSEPRAFKPAAWTRGGAPVCAPSHSATCWWFPEKASAWSGTAEMEAVKNSPPMKRPLSAVHANARKSCCAIGTLNQPGAQHENAGKPQPAPPFSCRTLSSTRSATPPAADV